MSRRSAFTLIELLVVAGIFAALFGLTLAMSRPNQANAVRRAAAGMASVLVATQSRALGNPVGAGVILDSAGQPRAVTSVSAADMLPFITGSCTGVPPDNRNDTSTTVSVVPNNAAGSELGNGYRIQFWRRSPVQPVSPWFGFESGNTARFRPEIGQTPQNTIWPEPVGSGTTFDVLIARYPNEGETLLDFPKNVAIDLRFSSVGDGATWSNLSATSSGTIQIGLAYDSLGGVDAVMNLVGAGSASAIHPTAPVFLLVSPLNLVQSGSSLASDSALWVVLHPQTGRVSVSSNVAQTGTDATALRNARAKARAQAAIGK
jgi:type II secretory pathway pseudopilin PulG